MKQIFANNFPTLQLGRHGENLARQVVFDLSDWISGYGDGVAELISQRPGDERPYPVASVRDGSTLVWTVSKSDTAVAASYGSFGHCELRWYVGDVLVKSKTWRTLVDPAMDTPSETAPPEPEQGWVEQVIAVGAAAKASADAAKADADRAAALAAEVAVKASQVAQDAAACENHKTAAHSARKLAENAQRAAEAAKQASEAAQSAAAQSATDADAAKQGAEAALKDAKYAASTAAKALSDIQALYQEMQTWAQGVIQTVSEAADSAGDSAVSAGNAADAAKDAQKDAEAARDRAETAAIKQPIPNADTGTWWVWDISTGAYIDSGEKTNSKDGKSAYQAAQDGGYTGTEAQFNSDLSAIGKKYEKPINGIPKTDFDSNFRIEFAQKANKSASEDGETGFSYVGTNGTIYAIYVNRYGAALQNREPPTAGMTELLLNGDTLSFGKPTVSAFYVYANGGAAFKGNVKAETAPTEDSHLTNKAYVDSKANQLASVKLDAPSATPEVGKILKVKQVNADGTFICEWADAPSGGSDLPVVSDEDKHKYLGIGVDSKWSVHPGQLSVVLDWYRNQDAAETVRLALVMLEERQALLEEARANLEARQAELQARCDESEAKKDEFLKKYEVSSPDELDEYARAEYDAMVTEGEDLKAEAEAAVEKAQAAVDEAEALVNDAQVMYDNFAEIYRQTEYALEACTEKMRSIVLPPVTYADNGKTLQVVDGKWAAV